MIFDRQLFLSACWCVCMFNDYVPMFWLIEQIHSTNLILVLRYPKPRLCSKPRMRNRRHIIIMSGQKSRQLPLIATMPDSLQQPQRQQTTRIEQKKTSSKKASVLTLWINDRAGELKSSSSLLFFVFYVFQVWDNSPLSSVLIAAGVDGWWGLEQWLLGLFGFALFQWQIMFTLHHATCQGMSFEGPQLVWHDNYLL